jgi:hypothetical protein
VQLAPERDAEIEAETVDMERRGPVAQRIHHHLQYARMGQIDGVAGAGVVDAMPAIVLNQAIIARVVEPAERQRRTELAAFRRMVVDDVENDLDAGCMQAADRDAHLVGTAAREIAGFDREKSDGVVTPVVPAFFRHITILQKGVDRQQLDRRGSQPPQIVDDLLIAERGEGAAFVRSNVLAQHGQAA